ncbi:MAG: 1-(5-phosphoribosyl)-5-[(5-phosphoribosylamino)methylideneamino]imidazole-4-carboxamide isomerase [Dehalococcoidia bacterium]
MEVIPAVDIKGGKCVRLYQGNFQRETVFSNDPVAMALRWQDMGAQRLHVVDLDGAASGQLHHEPIIEDMIDKIGIPLQLGGGIRTLEAIEEVLSLGVERVVLGTAAVEDPFMLEEACEQFDEAIVVGVDARKGFVATQGWTQSSDITATDFVDWMTGFGVRRFIYTDIARDGTLTEPNFDDISTLLSKITVPLIVSGGVSSVEHLKRLKDMGVEGAIVGRALYTGDLDLKEALAAVR